MDIDQLRDMAVVSVQQAEKLGTIDDVLIDLEQHRIGGLLLHGGLFHGGPVVGWASVSTIGRDAVMVDNTNTTGTATDGDVAGLTRMTALRGMKVVTDAGELAGTIEGAEIDPASGRITRYIVASPSGGLFHKAPRFSLPPAAIAAVGVDLITVDAKVIDFQREK